MESEFSNFIRGSECFLPIIGGTEDLVNCTDYSGHSLLHWAVHNGDLEMCRYLLSNGFGVDVQDSYGTTALMLASHHGFFEITKLLLEFGANVLLSNDYGANALTMACANDNKKLLTFLIPYLKEPTYMDDNKFSWLQHHIIISAACGSKNCIEFYYKQNHDCINLVHEISGMNALMLAEAGGFMALEEKLIAWGAKKNPQVKLLSRDIPSATLLTPIQNISFLFPSSPYCSPCCSRLSPSSNSSAPSGLLFPPQPVTLPATSGYSINLNNSFSSLLDTNSGNSSELVHPLTPNLCFSPQKNKNVLAVQKKYKPVYSWLKKLKRKRSRSLENLTKVKRKKSNSVEQDNILDYILSTANLSEYKSCFVDQEVTFRTFLTLNEDELIEIGIKKPKVRSKLMKLIHHYKRIFLSQI